MHSAKKWLVPGCALALCAAALVAYAQEGATPAGTAPADSTAPATAPATTAPAAAASAPTAAPAPADRVDAIKANITASAANLKQYQWIETQIFNMKGEDKSKTENKCFYGADGKVVKTPMAAPPAEEKKGGLRGKVVENKKEDIAEYMKSMQALMATYMPVEPMKIQAAKEASRISMTPLDGGKRTRYDVKDYAKLGDVLGIEVDMATNQIVGVSVSSYLKEPKDAVTLDVKMASLPDGTGYPATIVLNGVSEKIKVTTTNAAYTKKAQ